MSIGIADKKLKEHDELKYSDVHIIYYSDHRLWDSKELMGKQGKGYKRGECITVEVDFKASIIRWKVEGEIRC
jgi:hypothetical protein